MYNLIGKKTLEILNVFRSVSTQDPIVRQQSEPVPTREPKPMKRQSSTREPRSVKTSSLRVVS